jgi:pimeloyl-ACP methyl ester carboxylesterase
MVFSFFLLLMSTLLMFQVSPQNTAVSAEFCLLSNRGMFIGSGGLNRRTGDFNMRTAVSTWWGRCVFGLAAVVGCLCVVSAVVSRADDEGFEPRVYSPAVKKNLPYQLLKPLNYDPKQSYPLVLFLHGAGEMGTNNRSQLRHVVRLFYTDENRQKYPCFLLAPQIPEMQGRWDGKGGEMAIQLIGELQKEFNIDRQRIYIMGVSMGGYGTWSFIGKYPDMFAAAVPICGGGNVEDAPRIAKLPIWAFHGAEDDVVPADNSRKMISAIRQAGGAPRYTEYPDCKHDSWNLAIKEPDLLPWLFAQKRGEPQAKSEDANAAKSEDANPAKPADAAKTQ